MTFNKNLFKRKKAGFKTWGRKKSFQKPRAPALNPQYEQQDERYKRFLREIGSERIAKKCWELFQEFPRATLPELIAMEFLIRKQKRFVFQVFGLPLSKPDFLVFMPAGGLIWMIQGEYWHTLGNAEKEDAIIKRVLLGRMSHGVEIYKVLELWENDLYGEKAERTLERGLAGIEMRG